MLGLDIVIVNRNSTDLLLHCLRSVYDSFRERQARIFVQDNGSKDEVDRVILIFPDVLLSKNERNLGFARAVSKGLRQGSAPYVLLLNPDSVVGNGLFDASLKFMEENPEVGIIGPKILNTDGSIQGSARSFPNAFTGVFGRSTLLTRWFPNNRITRRNVLAKESDGNAPMEVDWVSGACMVVRRKAIEEVGLLDPRFFVYWEDADWCQRMWKKGWKVVYLPTCKVIHYVGGSSSENPFRSAYEFHKSSFKLFYKHSRPLYRLMSPFVAFALAMRFCMVVASRGIHRLAKGNDQDYLKGMSKRAG